jgi:O-acetyl-ADP-ribose deacetylase (regulator of RNase III)
MKIILVDYQESLIQAWQNVFENTDNVIVKCQSIFDMQSDAIVSPANSFGYMDGGLDLSISQFFGWHVQERLQELIRSKYHGELLVGQAEIVETDHADIPYVISAPTMRVPMILGETTVNVYLAMRAILLLITQATFEDGTEINSAVETVAIPGMGTGVGRVPPEVCANQMKTAFEEVIEKGEKYNFPNSWHEAQMRHQLLYSGSFRDIQY